MTPLNRVILTGKVVTPPRRHYRPDGSPVIQFPLELNDSEDLTGQALHRNGTGQGGRNRIDIVAFGKLAEFKLDLLQSGQHLMVIGRLNQRRWQTPEGKNRTCTEVIATALRTIKDKNQTQKSTLRLTDLKVDGCSELTLSSGKPSLQRRGLPTPNGSKKQGE
jgi:single-strand DNA-binding protein